MLAVKSTFLLVLCGYLLLPAGSQALPFGSPDSRALAMGGAGVTAADNANAGYFNPALLATYSTRKHKGGNQRIVFPTVSVNATDNVEELADVEDIDYDSQTATIINDFNNLGATAASVLAVLDDLDTDLASVSANPVAVDSQVGAVVMIPDRGEGGGFILSRRLVLDGKLNYSTADIALIDDYQEELAFVAGGGTPATLHPELYVAGQLLDPSDSFTSAIGATGLLIDELGIAMAWELEWLDTPLAFGFTPKWARVTTYDYFATATSSQITNRAERDNQENFNIDVGVVIPIDERLRVGVSIKNLVPQDYETALGRIVETGPQIRAGAEFRGNWGLYSIDLDLLENDPLSINGDPSQEIAFGAEWSLWGQKIRAGLHKNLSGTGDNAAIGYSAGFRFALRALFVDLAASSSSGQQAAALQFGVQF